MRIYSVLTNQKPESYELTNHGLATPKLTNQRPESSKLTNQGLVTSQRTNQRQESYELTNQRPEHFSLDNKPCDSIK